MPVCASCGLATPYLMMPRSHARQGDREPGDAALEKQSKQKEH
jgi:hypothetical protein